jgi:hypothetical protein
VAVAVAGTHRGRGLAPSQAKSNEISESEIDRFPLNALAEGIQKLAEAPVDYFHILKLGLTPINNRANGKSMAP